jgi:hypothetical protein
LVVGLCLSVYVEYLGVILGAWLTWKEHVNAKVKKARNVMWACRRWGLGPRVVHWLYI